MNVVLSKIIADLFEKSKGGEDVSSKIQTLRVEIKKIIESDDSIFGMLRGLEESFREIIPDEKQRYTAAIKALSTTSKLSRDEIIRAVNNQLEELKIVEKGLMPARPAWRDELKTMESKSQEMRNEIAKLREKIAQLESAETGMLNVMVARKKEMDLVEKAMKDLFTDIGEEIDYIKKKVEEFTVEKVAAPRVPQKSSFSSDILKEVEERKNEILASSGPQDTEWEKKCPMCGGRMNFHTNENMWQCYSCGFEEAKKEAIAAEQKSESNEPAAPPDTEFQKKCPMCGGQMNLLINEHMWQCYSCAYEESDEDEGQGKANKSIESKELTEEPDIFPNIYPTPHRSVPAAALSSKDKKEAKEWSLPKDKKEAKEWSSPTSEQHWTKKKTCPVCRKKMVWHDENNSWRCSFCDYERRI